MRDAVAGSSPRNEGLVLKKQINSFSGDYAFLSNFYPSRMYAVFMGDHKTKNDKDADYISVPTVEHAYQASKAVNYEDFRKVCSAKSPGESKRAGRSVKQILQKWDTVKFYAMEYYLTVKFSEKPFTDLLLSTGDAELIEGNTWGDTIWGVCNGKGENHLGKLLMKIREDLKNAR